MDKILLDIHKQDTVLHYLYDYASSSILKRLIIDIETILNNNLQLCSYLNNRRISIVEGILLFFKKYKYSICNNEIFLCKAIIHLLNYLIVSLVKILKDEDSLSSNDKKMIKQMINNYENALKRVYNFMKNF